MLALAPAYATALAILDSLVPRTGQALLPNGLTVEDDATITMWRYLDNSRRYRLAAFEQAATFGSIKQDLTRLRAYVAKQEESDHAVALMDGMLGEADDEPIQGTEAQALKDCLAEGARRHRADLREIGDRPGSRNIRPPLGEACSRSRTSGFASFTGHCSAPGARGGRGSTISCRLTPFSRCGITRRP